MTKFEIFEARATELESSVAELEAYLVYVPATNASDEEILACSSDEEFEKLIEQRYWAA